jgi:hypothetical protein
VTVPGAKAKPWTWTVVVAPPLPWASGAEDEDWDEAHDAADAVRGKCPVSRIPSL